MASLCRMCGDKAELITSLLDTSQHHLQWAINQFDIQFDGVLPTSVCEHCDDLIRDWTMFLNKRKMAKSLFSNMVANKQSLLYQLLSGTLKTSVPSQPSTSACHTRLSHQVSDNLLQHPSVDCIPVNNISSFGTPIEAIYLSDVESEFNLKESDPILEASSNSHLGEKQPTIQIEKPSNTASSSLPGSEKLQHSQEPRQRTSHTINSLLACKPSFSVPSYTLCSISTNSSASLSELNLLHHLFKKYRIKDLTIRVLRLSDQVLESLQHNHSVDCNVVDSQISEQRNVRIKLEPVTVDPCVCNDQVSDNRQQNFSSTVDDDDIEVPFEAIYDPMVKCEPNLVKTEQNLDLSACQIENQKLASVAAKQDNIGNAETDSEVQPHLLELDTSTETRSPRSNKDVNTSASIFRCAHCIFMTNCKSTITSHIAYRHIKMSNYKCLECGKNFNYRRNLFNHVSHVHPNICCYKCLLCKRGFQFKKIYNAHIKSHNKIFKCDVCGKIVSTKHYLKEHKLKMHTKSSALSCKLCSKIFYSDASLKAHVRETHSNLSYKCDICDKYFKFTSSLGRHRRDNHFPVRAFSCNQCGKAFKSKISLNKHSLDVHIALRPFKCEKCGFCFKSKLYYNHHVRNIRCNEGPLKCHLCCKCFKSKFDLMSHMLGHSDVHN